MNAPAAHEHYIGTTLFFAVRNVKELTPRVALGSILELNRVVSKSDLFGALGKAWAGTTATGLFMLVPDATGIIAHTHLPQLFSDLTQSGVAVRCGVGYGRFVCVEDADNELNFIGTSINTAARLTYAGENTGCLVHERYCEYVKGSTMWNDGGVLERASVITVPGKEHDEGFPCRRMGPPDLLVNDSVDERRLQIQAATAEVAGLVIAYDLPKFSAGDHSQIDKRIRSLVDAFHRLRRNRAALKQCKMYFCPGGDGGIVVLEGALEDGDEIALSIAREFLTESEYKESSISAEARIGVHYGPVPLYNDVRGTVRPTGRTCFAAEELTSDDYGKAAGLVFSEALEGVISRGSEKTLQREFEELPPLTAGAAIGLRRFARRMNAKRQFKHPLIERLFGPTSSWQTSASDGG